ncbi:YHS domain-containing protein [Methanocella sp. MCL-LM]|uniref:YHS domain-containing protein n=1 Tax=Methanocella sp. MCL-LM TaxID=3412035 RepID=UPI003C70AAAD
MAIDPVCNMTVYEELAVSCEEYKGKHYCFCSKACREAFDKDPDLHANKPYELLQS